MTWRSGIGWGGLLRSTDDRGRSSENRRLKAACSAFCCDTARPGPQPRRRSPLGWRSSDRGAPEGSGERRRRPSERAGGAIVGGSDAGKLTLERGGRGRWHSIGGASWRRPCLRGSKPQRVMRGVLLRLRRVQ